MLFATGLDELLIEAAKQVPSLVVLVFIVIRFLAQQNASEERRNQRDKAVLTCLQQFGGACHSFQDQITARYEAQASRITASLDRNTESLGRNTEAICHFETFILKPEKKG